MAEKTVAVRLSDQQKQQLETLAQKQKMNVSDLIRSLLEKETPKTPEDALAELQAEAQQIQAQIAEIEKVEEEKRIAEEERQRQEALAQLEAQIRQTLPDLLDLRYKSLVELVNNSYDTLAELSRQYDDLIEKVEQGDIESAGLKEKYLSLGGDFEALWTELMDAVEQVALSNNARQLLEMVRNQQAFWVQRADCVLRFLDTRLVGSELEI